MTITGTEIIVLIIGLIIWIGMIYIRIKYMSPIMR